MGSRPEGGNMVQRKDADIGMRPTRQAAISFQVSGKFKQAVKQAIFNGIRTDTFSAFLPTKHPVG